MSIYFVYILYSVDFDKYYIGQTNDIDARLKRHNSGNSKYTSSFVPWILVLCLEKESRSKAMILEKKLKNLSRERLKRFIQKYKPLQT